MLDVFFTGFSVESFQARSEAPWSRTTLSQIDFGVEQYD